MRLDLLTDLADYLEKHADEMRAKNNVDMLHWLQWVGKRDVNRLSGSECGFAACAVGTAILNIPSWQAIGLHWETPPDAIVGEEIGRQSFVRHVSQHNTPGQSSFQAVAVALEMKESQVDHLFAGGGYRDSRDPKEVADRIRAFIDTHQPQGT